MKLYNFVDECIPHCHHWSMLKLNNDINKKALCKLIVKAAFINLKV